jgi:hypothetical protein
MFKKFVEQIERSRMLAARQAAEANAAMEF